MFELLDYIRKAFGSQEMLDSIPLSAAANSGAYHAYKTFREQDMPKPQSQSRTTSPEPSTSRARKPGEWNWDGVWEERVKRGVQSTLSEPVLFGGTAGGDDVVSPSLLTITIWVADTVKIRFSDMQEEAIQRIKNQMIKS